MGNISNFEQVLPNLAKVIQEQGEQGFFVMGYGTGEEENKREYQFFEEINTIAFKRKDKEPVENEEQEEDPWIKEKINLLKSKGLI